MAPASPIPNESDTAVIPIENCLFSNGTWKQISQSDKILSSHIQIIQHTLYQIEQHVPLICCSRSVEVCQKQLTGNHKQSGWYDGNISDV
jgi:prephenate dehydratase